MRCREHSARSEIPVDGHELSNEERSRIRTVRQNSRRIDDHRPLPARAHRNARAVDRGDRAVIRMRPKFGRVELPLLPYRAGTVHDGCRVTHDRLYAPNRLRGAYDRQRAYGDSDDDSANLHER